MDIHTGHRDPVHDADHIHTDDSKEGVHFIHEAHSGSVNVNYSYENATSCVPAGGLTSEYDFDINGDHIDD